MLNEHRASDMAYSAADDTLTVRVNGPTHGARRGKDLDARLLLDARGFLVGIDARDDLERGVVVMLGPHEAVDTTRDVRVDASGDHDTYSVVIHGSRAAARGHEKNPYL